MIDPVTLEAMLAAGNDNALLRFTLGSAFIRHKKYQQAIEHLDRALEQDPDYSAAWKAYGKALEQDGQINEAIKAYRKGIAVAEKKGDKQAAKEMAVFLKRLVKSEL